MLLKVIFSLYSVLEESVEGCYNAKFIIIAVWFFQGTNLRSLVVTSGIYCRVKFWGLIVALDWFKWLMVITEANFDVGSLWVYFTSFLVGIVLNNCSVIHYERGHKAGTCQASFHRTKRPCIETKNKIINLNTVYLTRKWITVNAYLNKWKLEK